jgi:RNA recognition motif 2
MTSPDKLLSGNQYAPNGAGAAWQGAPQHGVRNTGSPPGFVGGQQTSSTPPPPGFKSESSVKLNSNANRESIRSGQGPSHGMLSAELAQASGGRTSSFVNLASLLGTGLAESMEAATTGDGATRGPDAQDLSFARQSRHAMARRLIGSPPRIDSFGLDLVGGGLIGAGSAAPATLAGGGFHLSRDLQFTSSHQQQQHDPKTVPSDFQGEGLLPGAFNSGREDVFGGPSDLRRDYSPLSMFGRRGQLPISKDLGVTVVEPGNEQPLQQRFGNTGHGYHGDSGSVLAALMEEQEGYYNDPQYQQPPQQLQQYDQSELDSFGIERGMRGMWMDDNASLGQASRQSRNRHQPTLDRSIADSRSGGSQSSIKMAEAELRSFLWDTRIPQHQANQYRGGQPATIEPSRGLAILRAESLQIPEVRSTCEAFGVIDIFRSEFADRGIIFVSYYDIRSAQYAALDLEAVLNRRESDRGGNGQDVRVYYCVPLNSSAQTDESRLVLSDVPPYVDEHSLVSMLSSYGAVRSLKKHAGYYGGSSYEAEFHNVQDARQALLELPSTQPWGADVAIEVGMRQPIDRKRGRELLAVIGRWRHGPKLSPSATTVRHVDASSQLNHGAVIYRTAESSASSSPAVAAPTEMTQLVLGPDGRYSYMIVNNQSGYGHLPVDDYNDRYRRNRQQEHMEPQRERIVHGPNGETYIATAAMPPSSSTNYRQGGSHTSRDGWSGSIQTARHHVMSSQYSTSSYHSADSRERLERISGPYYPQPHHGKAPPHPDHLHVGAHHHHPHHPHHAHSSNASNASMEGGEKDNKHLVLDLEAVEQGRDVRTSLMIRNIPNKYTRQMLLAEFTENGLGPGVIDFFYLPIDFKNRCNRGYAFINFVDFHDILPFHRRYFGKHWSTFNSDKICDITYARIQGKAAMLKRFENSALMEKDEDYKPLVFISHGPEKGTRIPFPEAATAVAAHHHKP